MNTENHWFRSSVRGRRRGRKRKVETQHRQVIEIHLPKEPTPKVYRPSSSLLPARPLGAPHEPVIKREIRTVKEEVAETGGDTPESDIIPSSTCTNAEIVASIEELLEVSRNRTENNDSECPTPQELPQPTNKIIMENLTKTDNLNPQTSKAVPDSSVGCMGTSTEDNTNCIEQYLMRVKCETRSRSSSTETVLATESQLIPAENHSVVSDKSLLPEFHNRIETLSGVETFSSASSNKWPSVKSKNLKEIEIGPQSMFSNERDASREVKVYSETLESGLINHSLKSDIVSLNAESQMVHKTASIISEPNTLNLGKTYDSRCDSLLNSSIKSAVTSVSQNSGNFPVEWNHSSVPLNREMANQSFISPIISANMSVSKHETPTKQVSTGNLSFKTNLLKFIHLTTEISRTDVKECLNYLNGAYPQTKGFSLFFNDKISQTQHHGPIVDTVQSPLMNSSTSLPENDISSDVLRKILETSLHLTIPNLPLPLQNDGSESNIVKGTENITVSSVTGNVSRLSDQSSEIRNEPVLSCQTFDSNVHIKTEPLGNYDLPSVTTSNKRSADETAAEMPEFTKKIKTEPAAEVPEFTKTIKTEPVSLDHSVLSSGDSCATEIKLRARTDECSSMNQSSTGSIQSQSDVVEHNISNTSRNWNLNSQNIISDKTTVLVAEKSVSSISSNLNTSQSDETKSQLVTSNKLLSPKIRIKTEPSYDREASSRDMCQESLTTNIKSAGEADSNVLRMAKNLNTQAECLDHSVASVGYCEVAPSKVSTNCPLISQSVSFVKNAVPVTKRIPQNFASVSCEQSSSTNERSSRESANDVHQKTKNIDTQAEPIDNSVASVGYCEMATSKVSTNCPLISESVSCVKNTVLDSKRISQNSSNVSCASSISRSKNSKLADSIATEPITSTFRSYLNLLPEEISNVEEEVSGIDNTVLNSSRISLLSAKPSTSINNIMDTLTKEYDTIITTNDSKRVSEINRRLPYNDTQSVEKTDPRSYVADDRNSHDASSTSAYRLDRSHLSITSKNERTRKKIKLTPEEYLQRKNLQSLRDPRLQKDITRNFSLQASLPDSNLFRMATVTITNEQNQNLVSDVHNEDAHQYYKSKCIISSGISPNIQKLQDSFEKSVVSQGLCTTTRSQSPLTRERTRSDAFYTHQRDSDVSSAGIRNQLLAQNSSVFPNSSRNNTKVLSDKPQDPRKSKSRSYYQKIFETGKPNQAMSSTSLRSSVGKNFIETDHLPWLILEWDVEWLYIQKKKNLCPPICDRYPRVKHTYNSVEDYYNTYLPLHLLNIWLNILKSWEKSEVVYNSFYETKQESQNFVKATCSVILSAIDKSKWPKREDLLICSSTTQGGGTKQFFGRVVGILERDYYPTEGSAYCDKPGVWKKLYLDILCAESFAVPPPAQVQLQYIINIRQALKQNDALRYMNPSMRAVILNPVQHRKLLQTFSMPPYSNVLGVVRGMHSSQYRVTIVNTQNSSESASTILHAIPQLLNANTILLVCVKDESAFLKMALQMTGYNAVLAVKDDEGPQLPPKLQKFAVKDCDSEILQSCHVILTLTSAMYFGELEKRLTKESVICMIHEAHCFYETETALPLVYKVEHLIMIGRNNDKADISPILMRNRFDVSLFHRFTSNSQQLL